MRRFQRRFVEGRLRADAYIKRFGKPDGYPSICESSGSTVQALESIPLREPSTNFLTSVMVMAEDPDVRANRLALTATS